MRLFVENVHEVGSDVVEQSLVVGDDDGGILVGAQLVDSLRYDAQGVDVEAAVGLVENRQAGLQHGHLEDFVTFLLSARKAFVDRAAGQFVVEFDNGPFLRIIFRKSVAERGSSAPVFALGVDSGPHEVDHAYAGNLHRVLEAEEDTFVRTVFGREGEQVFSP